MNDEQLRDELENKLEAAFEDCGNEGYIVSVVMDLLEDYDITKVINA